MDISLILFSVAMFFQPVEIQQAPAVHGLQCEYLGVDYPVGQKMMVSTKGQIIHQECKTYTPDQSVQLAVHWVEKSHQQ